LSFGIGILYAKCKFTGSPAIAISELRSLIDLCGLFRNFATLVAVSECLHLQELHSAALHFLQALSEFFLLQILHFPHTVLLSTSAISLTQWFGFSSMWCLQQISQKNSEQSVQNA
jgi:hypothetical protein